MNNNGGGGGVPAVGQRGSVFSRIRRSFRRKRETYCINCGHVSKSCYHSKARPLASNFPNQTFRGFIDYLLYLLVFLSDRYGVFIQNWLMYRINVLDRMRIEGGSGSDPKKLGPSWKNFRFTLKIRIKLCLTQYSLTPMQHFLKINYIEKADVLRTNFTCFGSKIPYPAKNVMSPTGSESSALLL
jgi:hypothetical protein